MCGGGGGWQQFPQFYPSYGQGPAAPQQTAAAPEDPLAVLKLRLAKGEIKPEDYERLAALLTRNQ